MRKLSILCAVAMTMAASPLRAADITVFSGGAPQAALQAMTTEFEAATGHKVTFSFQIVSEIERRLSAGDRPDLIMLPSQLITAIGKTVPLADAGRGTLARVGIGVIVPDGAAKPDLSSEDGVRTMLQGAKSIALADPSTPTGRHLAAMLARLGMSGNSVPRLIHQGAIHGGGETVATREADLGLYLVSEVQHIKGVTVAGLLPPSMQGYVVYATAIPAGNQTPEPALAFIRFLTAPDKEARWRRAGFELVARP